MSMDVDHRAFRIALLSSFTFNGMVDALRAACDSIHLTSEYWVAPYGQYQQMLLDEQSSYYHFQPDFTVLFVDYRTVFGDAIWSWYEAGLDERKKIASEKLKELTDLVHLWSLRGRGTLLVHNLEVPIYSPLGILETKDELGLHACIRQINVGLSQHVQHLPQAHVFDFDNFVASMGKRHAFDWKMYYLADMKYSPGALGDLANAYLGYVKPLTLRNRKCLVLDLDHTLWGGIVGEVGEQGIELGPTQGGRPYWEFQKAIQALYARGVILAINSKNNPDDALHVLRDHPYMALKEDHFAAMRINWEEKAVNMKALSKEINIGLDSMVFFDDDPYQRALMRDLLPEVLTLEVPNDPSKYASFILGVDDFNILQLTEEDKKKGQLYAIERKRRDFQVEYATLEDFLKQLELVVCIERASALTASRVAQLTQKTNQFTLTTRRYQEADIRRMCDDGNHCIYTLSATDRFGDYGLVGVAIIEMRSRIWYLDTFLLSCRVLGKGIENIFLSSIAQAARSANAEALLGEYIPTPKNVPTELFYRNFGFESIGGNDWRLALGAFEADFPSWVTVLKQLT